MHCWPTFLGDMLLGQLPLMKTEILHTAARWIMPFSNLLVTFLINNEAISKGRGGKNTIVAFIEEGTPAVWIIVLLKRVDFLKHECNRCLSRPLRLKGE